MDNFINIDKLNILNKFRIEFGIFQEDGTKVVDVDVLNTDETTSTTQMSIADIMYFTETGTMMLPGRHILDKCLIYINDRLDSVLDIIITDILERDISENEIQSKLTEFVIEIEYYVKAVFIATIHNVNNLGTLLNQDDENRYLYDLKKLQKYVKCKLIKVN
ncbi:MAG: hypothetical protein MR775_05080 [Erysipelotrichaceae bacterium]|nr:hypothetical protein [Erysipelotrichaceae bacterium]